MPHQLARMSHQRAFIYPILYAQTACMHASEGIMEIMRYVEVIVDRFSSAVEGRRSFPVPCACWDDLAPAPV